MTDATLRRIRATFYSTEAMIWLAAIAFVVCVGMRQWLGATGWAAALFANLRALEVEKSNASTTKAEGR